MTVGSAPCWNYPVGSGIIPSDPVTFTTVPFPVSPTTTAMSSPPSITAFPPLPSDVPPQPSHGNQNRRHQSKMSTTPSSLPNPKELSKEDDWTRVKCPKEKKRIQNRVAQRTYRESGLSLSHSFALVELIPFALPPGARPSISFKILKVLRHFRPRHNIFLLIAGNGFSSPFFLVTKGKKIISSC